MREAPSIVLIRALLSQGVQVRAFDPVGMQQARTVLPAGVVYGASAYEAARGADAAVLMTEWQQFRTLDLRRLKTLMGHPVVVDLRNVYDRDEMRSLGFRYLRIGGAPAAGVGSGRRGSDALRTAAMATGEGDRMAETRRARLSLVSEASPVLLGSQSR
jgi:UDPglucose 6-dehydrogenase